MRAEVTRGREQIRGVRERKERAETAASVETAELKRHQQYMRMLRSAVAFECQKAAELVRAAGLRAPG